MRVIVPRRWIKVGERFVCAPPKCGGSSLYCAAMGVSYDEFGRHTFSAAQKQLEFFTPAQIDPRCAILQVREPVSRFASLWRDKCRGLDENMPDMHGMTPDGLMNFIEANPYSNLHWAPQFVHWRPGVQLTTNLFAALGWDDPRANATRIETGDPKMPSERILNHYATDNLMYIETLRP